MWLTCTATKKYDRMIKIKKNDYLKKINMNMIHVSKKKLNILKIRESKFYQNYFL